MKQLGMKTFEAGILQARAYRTMRMFLQDELEKYELSMMQWALLGTIAASGTKGITINELAAILDVEGSLITNMVNTATKTGTIKKRVHPTDSRVRIVTATTAGNELVERVEKQLRQAMRHWLRSIPRTSLAIYIRTLEKIANL